MLNRGNFAVLMAVYKNDSKEKFIRAVESVIKNTLQPSQFLLVVDGPLRPELDAAVLRFQAEGVLEVHRLESNRGLHAALNCGLAIIRPMYTIRADADDCNHPRRFEKLMAFLESGHDIVGSAVIEEDENGKPRSVRTVPQTSREILAFLKRRNPFNHPSVAFRTSTVLSAGGYPDVYLREDYALWATLLSMGVTAYNIPEALVTMSAGTGQYVRRGGLKYARGELSLQRHLVRCGVKGFVRAFCDGIARSLVFLSPVLIRRYVYIYGLRRTNLSSKEL